jgi:hypothetical protein
MECSGVQMRESSSARCSYSNDNDVRAAIRSSGSTSTSCVGKVCVKAMLSSNSEAMSHENGHLEVDIQVPDHPHEAP